MEYTSFSKKERLRTVQTGSYASGPTGDNQLRSRLRQHFLVENKDRSIFRKNIGRALLNSDGDPFLTFWELDLTSRTMKDKHGGIDLDQQRGIELTVSKYIREHFSFVVVRLDEKSERLRLESKMISTVSLCDACVPSAQWLGLSSPIKKFAKAVFGLSTNSTKNHFLTMILTDCAQSRLVRFDIPQRIRLDSCQPR